MTLPVFASQRVLRSKIARRRQRKLMVALRKQFAHAQKGASIDTQGFRSPLQSLELNNEQIGASVLQPCC
jgi:hypothetical protein